MRGLVSELSIPFRFSVRLFFCQYRAALITLFVAYFEIEECLTSNFVLFSQSCFDYLESSVTPYKF